MTCRAYAKSRMPVRARCGVSPAVGSGSRARMLDVEPLSHRRVCLTSESRMERKSNAKDDRGDVSYGRPRHGCGLGAGRWWRERRGWRRERHRNTRCGRVGPEDRCPIRLGWQRLRIGCDRWQRQHDADDLVASDRRRVLSRMERGHPLEARGLQPPLRSLIRIAQFRPAPHAPVFFCAPDLQRCAARCELHCRPAVVRLGRWRHEQATA